MMTPIWLGTSWKMNKPLSQAMAWCETAGSADAGGLSPRYSALRHSPLHRDPTRQPFLQTHQLPLLTGAQNMHEADQGA
ncbi:triosephosphate isomerase [Klebsiella pneumoniae]|uniref:Triosephosphate isomerase n=1 Tax=Klebsiella pneumoniae TaxID=573 RepID=A0A377W7U9_KLEPN|nr:triosephosphate isomerase [Klebsiella pneumoniae]